MLFSFAQKQYPQCVVNVNTNTGEATVIRYGAGSNYVRCHETTSLDEIDNKYYRGEFLQA